MNPQPFPWHLVDHCTHENVRLLQHVRRFIDFGGASERIVARFAELVRAPVDLHLRAASIGAAASRKGAVAVALDDDKKRRFVVVVESALAASVVMRGMKRAPPRVVDPVRAAPEALAGAFAAFLVAASRASNDGPAHVAWCGDAVDLSPAALPVRVARLHATVSIDGETFEAHLYAPEDVVRSSPNRLFTSSDLIALGAIPLALHVVVSAATTSHADAQSLGVGDVWLPDTFLTRASNGKFFGDLVLASASSEHGVRARLRDDGSLVLLDGTEEIAMTAEERAVVGNAGEAPVVVRVEVGSVTLAAREWSALRAGDVIATAQKISDPVVLRVGGVEVARGELVDVDGTVGVRILSRS